MKIKILTLALILSFGAVAGDRSFNCTINKVYKLNSLGEIELESGPSVPRIKDTFNVDRRSGVIVGERIPIFRPDKFFLLADGNDGNAFVVSYSAKTRVAFLRIENYLNTNRAPFLLQDGIWVVSGLCE